MAKPSKAYNLFPRNDLTADYVRSIVAYNPDTGIFTWKWSSNRTESANKRYEGQVAGHCRKKFPYIIIAINKTLYLGHRLAWLYMTGKWPKDRIDHVDRDGTNNKWSNLREATCWQNSGNCKTPTTNKTGFKGACKVGNKFRATITVNKVHQHLGYYETAEQAAFAYRTAAKTLRKEFSESL